MAVEAVSVVILEKLTDLLIQDSIAFDNVIDHIEDIRIQLRHMRGFLINAEAELSRVDGAFSWTTHYLSLLFSAENKIEHYILFLAAHGRRKIGFFQSRGFTLFAATYDFFGPGKMLRRELRHLSRDIGDLEEKLTSQVVDASSRAGNPNSTDKQERVKRRWMSDELLPYSWGSLSPVEQRPNLRSSKSFTSMCERGSKFAYGSSSGSPDSSHHEHPEVTRVGTDQEGPTLIGFTVDRRQLEDRIMNNEREGVIPLVGLAGSGKTNLVQKIYRLKEIKTRFDCRAWIHIPDRLVKTTQLLADLHQQVDNPKEGGGPLSAKQLISRVHGSLQKKTYLVVLDNVSQLLCWNELKPAFPNLGIQGSKSKVIIITRKHDLASLVHIQDHLFCGQPHPLKTLCDLHSWELFTKNSCSGEGIKQPDDQGFKKVVLEKCMGCPFMIVLLGGLLSTKWNSCDQWKWYLSQPSWDGMEILPLCYNDLPAHSKLCLLYMALFPNESDIPVRRLLRLWLAEGFVRRDPGMYEEDAAEECFLDLVKRNLIKISKYRSDGSAQKCHMPHALFDYLYPIAQKISLFYIHQEHHELVSSAGVSPKEQDPVYKLGVRRVIEYVDIKSYNPTPESPSSPSYENLRSYISFNFQRNDTPSTEVGNFIWKNIGSKGFGVLRVLDLERIYKPTLPETLKQLFHLRYLGLRWTFIDHIPKSVGELPYLETLDLKRTYINSLPSSIWKLERLRHLNLPGIRLEYNQNKGHNYLTGLKTLVGLVVDDETAVKDELSHICELRELGITCQTRASDEVMKWIQVLANLKFLWLKSKDKMGRPSKIKLKPLSMLSQLSHVSLLGNIERLPALHEFPPNLKVLALSVTSLVDDPMTILSKLPCLTMLRLQAESYLGTCMKCPANGFKNLRVLRLWMLKELVQWTVEEGGMPNLTELSIRKCCKLKQLPDSVMGLDSLEELNLTAMPKEFVDNVKQKDKRNATLTINDEFEFTSLPWEKDPELWNN